MSKPKFYFDIVQHIFDPVDPFQFQASQEWLNLRANRITASYAKDLLSNGRTSDGLGKSIKKLIGKRLMGLWTGWVDDSAISFQEKECVLRGLAYERQALEWYSTKTGKDVVPCGFISRGKYIGCSPDGLVIGNELKMVQVKIPMPGNFPDAIEDYDDHIAQIEMELFVADLQDSDLLIYSPELGIGKIIPVKRNPRTDTKILSKLKDSIRYQRKRINEIEGLMKCL